MKSPAFARMAAGSRTTAVAVAAQAINSRIVCRARVLAFRFAAVMHPTATMPEVASRKRFNTVADSAGMSPSSVLCRRPPSYERHRPGMRRPMLAESGNGHLLRGAPLAARGRPRLGGHGTSRRAGQGLRGSPPQTLRYRLFSYRCGGDEKLSTDDGTEPGR